MQIELLSVGTELLLGEILDTNAAYLAEKLSGLGINVYYQTTVGDNLERLAAALHIALARADGVLATGGLGPTEDDLTAAAVARVAGLELALDEQAAARIRAFARQRGLASADGLLKQARVPAGARPIPNPVGTAPGFILSTGGKIIIALPGVPTEMTAMAEQTVLPYLAELAAREGAATIVSRVLRLAGIGESQAEAQLQDLIQAQSNPTIAPLAKPAEVRIRLTARAPDRAAALEMIRPLEQEIRRRLGEHIYGADDETLEQLIGGLLRARGETLALAESCTGGLIGHRITAVPGSSAYLLASLVTYADEAKVRFLGVPPQMIRDHGAVSAEVARAMAAGARRACGADVGLSVTGIAGPTGATDSKPVGLTYVAVADADGGEVEEHHLRGDRAMVKERGAQAALYLLLRRLRRRAA